MIISVSDHGRDRRSAELAEVEIRTPRYSNQEKRAVAPPPTADVPVLRQARAPLLAASRLVRAYKALLPAQIRTPVHTSARHVGIQLIE